MKENNHILYSLNKRSIENNPINLAVIGAGWFGSGVISECNNFSGIRAGVIFERNIDKAINAYISSGIKKEDITTVNSYSEFSNAINDEKYIVTNNIDLINELKKIDVLFDATGDVLMGAKAAEAAIKQKIKFATSSSELDSTVGYILNKKADESGVVYSNTDGDQPGVLAKMVSEIKLMGFEIAVVGNGKGFLDIHSSSESVKPFVRDCDNVKKIVSFADGTKQAIEMAVLANGINFTIDKRGMNGVKTTKKTLIDDVIKNVKNHQVVDYIMGKNEDFGMTVFVIGKRTKDTAIRDLIYLKRGNGPYYLFFKDYHLCYFETLKTIVEVCDYSIPTISPEHLRCDVFTLSKRNLKSGDNLDCIGGDNIYGLIDKYEIVNEQNLLPIGLAEYTKVVKDIKADTPITYDMVEFTSNNLVIELRKKQDELFKKNNLKVYK